MKIFLIIFISTLSLWIHVSGERISETKCATYSKFRKSIESHRIWMQFTGPNSDDEDVLGTVISDKFLLSAYRSDFYLEQIKVFTVRDEARTYFGIDEIFTRPIFNFTGVTYGIILVKLKNTIWFNQHRPYCMSETPTASELILDESLKNTSSFTPENCFELLQTPVESTVFCFLQNLVSTGQIIVQHQHLYGLVLATVNETVIATRLYEYLDWIERHVWPEDLCGRRQIDIESNSVTAQGQFPWHIALFEVKDAGTKKYICGGTILNELTVLTAAHCVSDHRGTVSPDTLLVVLELNDLTKNFTANDERTVSRILPHSWYQHYRLRSDIAILKLRSEIYYSKTIQPICIVSNINRFPSSIGLLPGWRQSMTSESNSMVLGQNSYPIRTVNECRTSNRHIFSYYMNSENFCAGNRNETNVGGDSGGGMVFNVHNQWFIRGILSMCVPLPNRMCDPTQFLLFTNVTSFYDWIVDKMRNKIILN